MGKIFIQVLIFIYLAFQFIPIIGQVHPAENIKRIQNRLNSYDKKNTFHGGVLIANRAKILIEKSYGENTHGVRNKQNSKFDIASIGKIFTGIVCAQLVNAGKINYDDYLIKYFPELRKKDQWKQIKISHLLTHTSGIPDIFDFRFIEKKIKDLHITTDDYFFHYEKFPYSRIHFKDEPLEFKPGTRFKYSNSGYLLLGLIIEKVVGYEYKDYCRKHILSPANMMMTQDGNSYGGGLSTMTDMFSFAQALINLKLINKSSYDEITSGKVKVSKKEGHQWGYGVEVLNYYRTKIITHKGGTAESKAKLLIFPETDYFVIIYSNNNKNGYKEFLKLIALIQEELS